MTKSILDRLEELERAATPGPWVPQVDALFHRQGESREHFGRGPLCWPDWKRSEDDAKLISIMRNHIGALIAVARAAIAAEKEFMGIDDGFFTGLVPQQFANVSVALRALEQSK